MQGPAANRLRVKNRFRAGVRVKDRFRVGVMVRVRVGDIVCRDIQRNMAGKRNDHYEIVTIHSL